MILLNKKSIYWSNGRFRIFGIMDGFSLVRWAVNVVNPFDVNVYCLLSVVFLDHSGKRIESAEKWKWFPDAYSKHRHVQTDSGFRYLIKENTVKEISGVVKTSSVEAGRISKIDFHLLQETFCPNIS